MTSATSPEGAAGAGRGPVSSRVILLFKPTAAMDGDLALSLESALSRHGIVVLLARRAGSAVAWAREYEQGLRRADLVIPLVSAATAQSELLGYELELAVQIAQERRGRPQLFPVRVFHRGPVSEALDAWLRPVEFRWDAEEERHRSRQVRWEGPADTSLVVAQVVQRLDALAAEAAPAAPPAPRPRLEPAGGAVPLDSAFYLEREADHSLAEAVARGESLVLVKGARQMGKTSLLARGLQQARAAGRKVVLTDFQKLQAGHLEGLGTFYRALCDSIADQLDVAPPAEDRWGRNPNAAFEAFWIKGVLPVLGGPVLWGMDEFDRVFGTGVGPEFCALLRSWHNARSLDPALPWGQLTAVVAYATEAHLFIPDLNQSPFNVGRRLTLQDFTPDQVAELNRRHGSPLRTEADLGRFMALLGGQPYLVRCALNEMAGAGRSVDWIEHLAGHEETVFGEHLRRLAFSIGRDPGVLATVRDLLNGTAAPSLPLFHRLRSAGVLVGESPEEARLRCGLYETHLRRHLR